jgi:putative transcriptional regulator
MEVRWKLRMAAAQREIWTGAQLRRLLAERAGVEMSAASVSALMRQAPKQLKLSTLQALCVALDCQPGDLIEVDTTPVVKAARGGKPQAQRAERRQSRSRTPPPF